jgi:alkanesulfonate monooxygenase SsuD/methylene tetrahydromethanopterin reductase-like flavin-dependent oxidoreductase (luciferase family)
VDGEPFSYSGRHYTVARVRFRLRPVQRPRIPVWVGGILPAARPIARAARWDGMVPILDDPGWWKGIKQRVAAGV